MKRRLAVAVALVAALSMVMAVPATAKTPLEGDMKLYFNLGFGNEEAPCPGITWAGTVELGGDMFGIAYFPVASADHGNSYHFEEVVELYETPFEFTGGVLTACQPGGVVLAGTSHGVESNLKYRINGNVADAYGSLAEWDGRKFRVRGHVTMHELVGPDGEIVLVPATAHGTFRLN